MSKLPIIILLLAASNAFSQDWPVKKLVAEKKATQFSFKKLPVFTFIAHKTLAQRGTYQQLNLDASFKKDIMAQRPEAIQVSVPVSSTKSITCDLVKFSLGNIKFTENNHPTETIENLQIPVTYRGVVTGEKNKNTVLLTVNEDYLSLVATFTDKVIQVSKADEKNNSTYRLYNSTLVQFPEVPFDCGNKDQLSAKTSGGIDLTGGQTPTSLQDKCVNVFVDCFDSLYQWRGSNKQQTVNYVYELFNSVATGYFNEQVNVQITAVNVWTTMDPYRGDNRDNALYDLANNWKDNFWGNICVGLDYSVAGPNRSGLAGGIGKIKAVSANTCPVFNQEDSISACCYNDMDYRVSVQNFPTGPNTTGQQVYLVMHEMGHLLGVNHTKWCGWKLTSNPDTYGAIDSCGTIEGSCMQGPPPPANGSTIMSYCVTSTANGNFVNYYNGFGILPGNAIRNFVDQSPCILTCV